MALRGERNGKFYWGIICWAVGIWVRMSLTIEPFSKVKTTFCNYWTSIKIKISMTCVCREESNFSAIGRTSPHPPSRENSEGFILMKINPLTKMSVTEIFSQLLSWKFSFYENCRTCCNCIEEFSFPFLWVSFDRKVSSKAALHILFDATIQKCVQNPVKHVRCTGVAKSSILDIYRVQNAPLDLSSLL